MGKRSNRRRRNRRQLIFLAIFFLFAGIAWSQYETWKVTRDLVKVEFTSLTGVVSKPFWLEVATTSSERSKGLMFRKQLAADRGMLFSFPYAKKQSFWMRNTFVSLDMLFVDSDWQVVGLLERVPINNDLPRSVEAESLYIIELLAGSAAKNKIAVGTKVKLTGVIPDAE